MERALWSRIDVAQLDRALPPSLPRPWLKETGRAKCDADQEAYEVACMELAAFLAWLIAQAHARRATEVLADMKSRRGLLAEVATSWMRLPDDAKMEWIPSESRQAACPALLNGPSCLPRRCAHLEPSAEGELGAQATTAPQDLRGLARSWRRRCPPMTMMSGAEHDPARP
eukprot:s498_g14.t2